MGLLPGLAPPLAGLFRIIARSSALALNVRYGSLADIRERVGDVRFTPESRHTNSDNDSFAAVYFPQALWDPTKELGASLIPPILHDGGCTVAARGWAFCR
jgi:hypothetical protein